MILRFSAAFNWLILAGLIVVSYLPVIGSHSVFQSLYPLPPDSLDWIIQGRYLWNLSDAALPVLRNPGFVWISASDHFTGNNGIAFATANALGLASQWLAFLLVARWAHIRPPLLSAFLLAFFLVPTHYVSALPLSDGLAVGLFLLGAVVLGRAIHIHSTRQAIAGTILGLLSALIQIYGLIILLVGASIVLANLVRPKVAHRKFYTQAFLGQAIALAIFFSVKIWWESTIPHETVPTQIGLLDLKFTMASFYSSVWFYEFGPLVIPLAICLLAQFKLTSDALRRLFTSQEMQLLAFGASLLLVASFFYQWPESRFSYVYVGAFYIAAMVVAHRVLGAASKLPTAILLAPLLIVSVLLGLIATPANPWELSLRHIKPGNFWAIPLDASRRPLAWVDGWIQASCGSAKESRGVSDLELSSHSELDPYQTKVLVFARDHCLD
jgi:hypothetical protein